MRRKCNIYVYIIYMQNGYTCLSGHLAKEKNKKNIRVYYGKCMFFTIILHYCIYHAYQESNKLKYARAHVKVLCQSIFIKIQSRPRSKHYIHRVLKRYFFFTSFIFIFLILNMFLPVYRFVNKQLKGFDGILFNIKLFC